MLWEEVMTILLETSIPISRRKKKEERKEGKKDGRKEGFVSCFQVSFVGDLSSPPFPKVPIVTPMVPRIVYVKKQQVFLFEMHKVLQYLYSIG